MTTLSPAASKKYLADRLAVLLAQAELSHAIYQDERVRLAEQILREFDLVAKFGMNGDGPQVRLSSVELSAEGPIGNLVLDPPDLPPLKLRNSDTEVDEKVCRQCFGTTRNPHGEICPACSGSGVRVDV